MRTAGLVLVSAVLAGLAHPPLGLWWTLLFAPAVLFGVLHGKPMRAGFGWAWLWWTVYALTLGYSLGYLIHLRTGSVLMSIVGLVLVAALSACFAGLAGALIGRMPLNLWGVLGASGVWVFFQWLRGLGAFAFVWGQMAPALYRVPVLLQIADTIGAWGLEWLILFWNALLAYAWRARQWRLALGVGAAFWAGWLGYGVLILRQSQNAPPTARVAIVQPNVNLARPYAPAEWEPIREQIEALVRQAGQAHPDLIPLPEVLEPYPMPESRVAFERWQQLARETGAAILVGGYRLVNPVADQWANTAHLFLPDGAWRYHDKVQLVPLGETVPFREYLPFLAWFGVVEEDLQAGARLEPLAAGELRIGAVICMESTYPWIARGLAARGANLLWVGSNESWFGRTPALEQHLAFSVLRAVETRRWVVRCAPEGYSAFIAPTGEMVRVEPFTPKVQVQTVSLSSRATLYGRYGDWIVVFGACWSLLGLMSARRRVSGGVSARPKAT